MHFEKNGWSVIYERAIREDGSLYFPQKLTKEFLDNARKTMGSYLFANQYLNEIIPDDEKRFKSHWLKNYRELPENVFRFGFIDPAIGQKHHHDYTAIVVCAVDDLGNWYVEHANRYRVTPTEIVSKCFEVCKQFKLSVLGIEQVAYQEALLYFLDQEMRKRNTVIPVKGITRNKETKQSRILGLVPRFEWGRIYLSQGLVDLEDELNTFPRGSHDDVLDALASLEEIVFYPEKPKKSDEAPAPNSPEYESWFIRTKLAGSRN